MPPFDTLAADTLGDNKERTRFALAAARAAIWEADLASGRVEWSDTMDLVMGRSQSDFAGTIAGFLELIHAEDRELLGSTLRRLPRESDAFQFEARVIWPDGSTHWMQSRGRVLRNDRGEVERLLGVAQDITEHKQLEAQFLQAHKMEALGRVAGGVAHDFNNILTAILGFAMLIDEETDANKSRDHAFQIRKAAERAAILARQLLTFSRRQVLTKQPVQLSTIASQVLPMLKQVLGEQVEIALDLDPAQHAILGDASQIEQVILNLAINARDAMPAGGRLTVGTRNVYLRDGHTAELDMIPGAYAVLEVTDTGIGMDAETRAKIFEPFFTTKAAGEGTGLGLATVYGIVKQMGGGVSVDSQPGLGTTFRIFFPRSEGMSASADFVERRSAPRGSGETVLLVEDEEPVRELLSAILRRNGYRVLTAGAAAEAYAVVSKAAKPVHLVLSDVMMPGGNGLELMATLKQSNIAPPALYMSGYSGSALQRQGNLEAQSAFLQKPFTNAELLTKIREVLDLVGNEGREGQPAGCRSV